MTLESGTEFPARTAGNGGSLLIGPQQYPSLDRERRLAEEFGLELLVAPDPEAFRASIPDATVVMVTPYAPVEAQDFAAMRSCIAVVRYGIGYDNIDVAAARRKGIPVAIVPGAATEEVASHALTMGLLLARRIPAGQAAIEAGQWAGSIGMDTPRFSQMDVAVIGMGRIGHQVAQWYAALGANVRAFDPFATFDVVPAAPLEELLEQSDVVSLHLPLAAETRNLISAEVIGRMRPRSVIVNVSRGGLVDEAALAAALRSGHLAGAGLDTFTTEPLPADHVLRGVPNLVMTPHVAWRSDVAMDTLQEAAVLRARQALTGQPLSDLVT
ncbi:C-terminal binding protein [Sphaerisporangium sp. NPDC051011]|uniref:C-terminal binding protein n=1 Tax=Sphaerisporangium sp. NPDC051011 TaxID=3155792 RepID=UPI0033CDB82E